MRVVIRSLLRTPLLQKHRQTWEGHYQLTASNPVINIRDQQVMHSCLELVHFLDFRRHQREPQISIRWVPLSHNPPEWTSPFRTHSRKSSKHMVVGYMLNQMVLISATSTTLLPLFHSWKSQNKDTYQVWSTKITILPGARLLLIAPTPHNPKDLGPHTGVGLDLLPYILHLTGLPNLHYTRRVMVSLEIPRI